MSKKIQDQGQGVLADRDALELLAWLEHAPEVPLVMRHHPAFQALKVRLQKWVTSVERRLERQEVQR